MHSAWARSTHLALLPAPFHSGEPEKSQRLGNACSRDTKSPGAASAMQQPARGNSDPARLPRCMCIARLGHAAWSGRAPGGVAGEMASQAGHSASLASLSHCMVQPVPFAVGNLTPPHPSPLHQRIGHSDLALVWGQIRPGVSPRPTDGAHQLCRILGPSWLGEAETGSRKQAEVSGMVM